MIEVLPDSVMMALHAVAGVLLGALAAGAHLALTRWRARALVGGRVALAWAASPLGLLALGAALFAAAQIADVAAWSFVIGVFAARALILSAARGTP